MHSRTAKWLASGFGILLLGGGVALLSGSEDVAPGVPSESGSDSVAATSPAALEATRLMPPEPSAQSRDAVGVERQRFVDANDSRAVTGMALRAFRVSATAPATTHATDGEGTFAPGEGLAWTFTHSVYGRGQVRTPLERRSEPVLLQRPLAVTFDVTLVDALSSRIQLRLQQPSQPEDVRVSRTAPSLLTVESSGTLVVADLLPGWWSVQSPEQGTAIVPALVLVDGSTTPIALRVGPLVDQLLRGSVTDRDGVPCAEVVIQSGSGKALTDAQGSFRLARRAGDDDYTFLTVARGDPRWREVPSFGPVLFGDEARIVLARRTTDRAQIRRGGRPTSLQSPTIRMPRDPRTFGSSNHEYVSMVTIDGWLALPPLAQPDAIVRGSIDGVTFAWSLSDFSVEREDATTRDFVQDLGEVQPIRVFVRGEQSGPLTGAVVEVIECSGGVEMARTAEVTVREPDTDPSGIGMARVRLVTSGETDTFGEVVLQVAPSTRTFVRARAVGHMTHACEIPRRGLSVQLSLVPSKVLRGHLVDANGALRQDVGGTVHLFADRDRWNTSVQAELHEGRFELQRTATTGWLLHRRSIRAEDAMRQVFVRVEDGVDDVEIPCDDALAVPVRLQLSGDPGPAAGDWIHVVRDLDVAGERWPWRLGSIPVKREGTDLIAETALPPGDYGFEWSDPRTSTRLRGRPGRVTAKHPVDTVCEFRRGEVHLLLRHKERPDEPLVRPVVRLPQSASIRVGDVSGLVRLPVALPKGTVLELVEPAAGGFRTIGRTDPLRGDAHEVALCTFEQR